jgi:hypothetical protein
MSDRSPQTTAFGREEASYSPASAETGPGHSARPVVRSGWNPPFAPLAEGFRHGLIRSGVRAAAEGPLHQAPAPAVVAKPLVAVSCAAA